MEQNTNAQNSMNTENAMNAENTMNTENAMSTANAMNTDGANVERLIPTAEVIEYNDSLTAKITEMLGAENPDYDEINTCIEEQHAMHQKYTFFDQTFEENGLVGVKDVKGNVRVPALYTDFYQLYDYLDTHSPELKGYPVCAYDANDKCALVTTDGKGTPFTPFVYDVIAKDNFSNNFMTVNDEKKGMMDKQGTILIPCEMDTIYDAFNGIYTFEAGGKFGLYTDWKLYIAPIYDEMTDKDDNIYVRLGDTWGYLDYDGKFIDEADQETLDESDLLNYEPNF